MNGLAASFYFTNAQFTSRGIGAFIGQITSVQVQSTDQSSESGTVQLTVTTVVAGTLTASTITLSYTRVLSPSDDESNWDLIAPKYVSLGKVGVGRSVLVHFTQSNGTYYLASAGNSVQDASDGLLIAKVLKIDDDHGWAHGFDKDHSCRQVQLQVIEVVYGWLNGSTTVSLCSNSDHDGSGRDAIGGASAPWSASGNSLVASDHDHSGSNDGLVGQEVFIAFDKRGISNIEVATAALLQQVQQADMQ